MDPALFFRRSSGKALLLPDLRSPDRAGDALRPVIFNKFVIISAGGLIFLKSSDILTCSENVT